MNSTQDPLIDHFLVETRFSTQKKKRKNADARGGNTIQMPSRFQYM